MRSPQKTPETSRENTPQTHVKQFQSICHLFSGAKVKTPHAIYQCIEDARKSPIDNSATQNANAHADSSVAIPVCPEDTPTNPVVLSETAYSEKTISSLKLMFIYFLLGGRFFSCMYRFVTVKDGVLIVFKVPGLNQWDESPNVIILAESIAALMMITDMIQTIRQSKKSVRGVFSHPNWLNAITQLLNSIRKDFCVGEKYPKKLLFAGLCAMICSGMQGQIGVQHVLERISSVSGTAFLQKLVPVSYVIGACSAFCFTAFQWFGESIWVVRSEKNLENNSEWAAFQTQYQSWLRLMSVMGIALSAVGALTLASGISTTSSNHQFHLSKEKLALFLCLTLPRVYYNYKYAYNPVFKLKTVTKKHDVAQCGACQSKLKTEEESQSIVMKIIGYCSAIGGSFIMMSAMVRTMQMLFAFDNQENNPWLFLSVMIAAIPFVVGSFFQNMALWVDPPIPTQDKKTNQKTGLCCFPWMNSSYAPLPTEEESAPKTQQATP